MKKLGYLLILIICVLMTVGLSGYKWWIDNTSATSTSDEAIYFVVPKGASAMQIGNKLYESGLIKSTLAYKVYVQLNGKSQNINAGEFKLSKAMNISQIVATLQGGPLELWVTIPEGLRREEIAGIVAESLGLSGDKKSKFTTEFLDLTEDKEGYLFPDTYLFPPDAPASKVADKLTLTFEKKISDKMRSDIHNSDNSLEKVIVMASIIERETKTGSERPVVAGILWKRLDTSGWLLQADATLQYAVSSTKCKVRTTECIWWPILTKEDLEIDSPYNSYKYKSLPPTPIANPGLSAINAAIYPEESDYWFYIHDAEGSIHYAKTIQEHNQNVSKYLGK